MAEERAGDGPADGEREKRHDQTLLVPVQARRDEAPHLVGHEGRRQDEAAHQGEVEVKREAFARPAVDERRFGRQ